MINDILDSIIHAIDSDDLRWCGESFVLVAIPIAEAAVADPKLIDVAWLWGD